MRCHSLVWTLLISLAFVPHSFGIRLIRQELVLVRCRHRHLPVNFSIWDFAKFPPKNAVR